MVRTFLIWSIEHDAWWGPGWIGYTRELAAAGRYSEPDARAIVAKANYPPGTCHEAMIPLECLVTVEREPPISQRLDEAIQQIISATRGFNERNQEFWCCVCRYKDPLGTALHDPACPIYELHDAWEKARKRSHLG